MNTDFRVENFRRIKLEDRAELEKILASSPDLTCEFTFTNLYVWDDAYHYYWQYAGGILYVWLKMPDILMMAESAENGITAEHCLAASAEMRKHGFSGSLFHIRQETIARLPELAQSFRIRQMEDDFGEYLYSVEELASLKGEKYSAKRNLIAQFKRNHPDYQVVSLSGGWIPDARNLAAEWRAAQENPDSEDILNEWHALERAFASLAVSGMESRGIVADGRLAAFSLFSPVTRKVWDESFEKSRRDCKGVSQLIVQETAKALLGRTVFLNREQDLGIPGIRKAKQSLHPALFLKNFILTPPA